jgi:hypothetical protein
VAALIHHPHAIPIHAAGEEDGVPFLGMEFVDGDEARSLVRHESRLVPERAARIVRLRRGREHVASFTRCYSLARGRGMAALRAADRRLVRRWLRRVLTGYWTHAGYLN